MSDEKLIEEARRAIHAAIPGSGDYEDWVEAIPSGLDRLGDMARAALAVFEQAQKKPKRDTSHPLADYISSEIHGDDETITVYGSQVQGDGWSVYLEGEHIDRGEFSAVVEITEFHLVEES